MKQQNLNKIAEVQAAEEKAAAEARKAAEEKAILDAVEPKDILDMLTLVENGTLVPVTDENDNIIGINCPGHVTGVAVTGKVGRHIVMGADEAGKNADLLELKKFEKAFAGKDIGRFFELGLMLKEAQVHPEHAERINGTYYFVINAWKKVIDERGNTIVDVSDKIKGKIDAELLTSILVDKLHLVR